MQRAVSVIKIVWTVLIVLAATTVGAIAGWENHGLVGAIALGFVGAVFGVFLSQPSMLLEFLG
ncbi:hypothetical protein ACO34A_11765 [Rhizobium sp. ACO-34A]|nr:hypothetical protein [Rhizobium sp. ACO-34A]ATN34478.1 hypothetical protein ACO34A_11765 [Rhizobium sp. ACO-34A]